MRLQGGHDHSEFGSQGSDPAAAVLPRQCGDLGGQMILKANRGAVCQRLARQRLHPFQLDAILSRRKAPALLTKCHECFPAAEIPKLIRGVGKSFGAIERRRLTRGAIELRHFSNTDDRNVVISTVLLSDVVLGQLRPEVPARQLPIRRVFNRDHIRPNTAEQGAEVRGCVIRMEELKLVDRSHENDLRRVWRILRTRQIQRAGCHDEHRSGRNHSQGVFQG